MDRRIFFALPLFTAAAWVAACSSDASGTAPTTTTGTNDAGADVATSTSKLSFTPSNLDLSGIDLSNVGDFVVDQANCTMDVTQKLLGCGDNGKLAFGMVTQPNGGETIAVFVARSFRVEANASLISAFDASNPIALVALDTFEVDGTIDVSVNDDYRTAGGFRGITSNSIGLGPGGGSAGSQTNGGGGAGFCGTGGKGASNNGTAVAGGPSYGTPDLIPLVGGSAGGAGLLPSGGSGGGAIQLVAGTTFTLSATGVVAANGGGGGAAGAVSSQMGCGGGAGGAILIEAPTTNILGSLVANGGAGGGGKTGPNGTVAATNAVGDSTLQFHSTAGSGSASEDPNGSDATWNAGDPAPGGGGAAGRIRVNSSNANQALKATLLSPSANQPCTTEGVIKP